MDQLGAVAVYTQTPACTRHICTHMQRHTGTHRDSRQVAWSEEPAQTPTAALMHPLMEGRVHAGTGALSHPTAALQTTSFPSPDGAANLCPFPRLPPTPPHAVAQRGGSVLFPH